MNTIVPLAQSHCPEVARLHLDYLRTGFRGRPGLELLAAYYEALVQSEGGCGFVTEQAGQVAGYVCGVWEPAAVWRTLLRARWLALVCWGLAQVAVRPRILTELVGRLMGSAGGSASPGVGYELRPIVVAPAVRGTGIGFQLVHVLLEDAVQRGFERVYLYAEEDNAAANALYRKVGFRLASRGGAVDGSCQRYEYVLANL